MGQAKRRGTYDERRANAIEANGGEERPKRLGAFDKRQIERQILREVCGMWKTPPRNQFSF